jgi:hypothetical protein
MTAGTCHYCGKPVEIQAERCPFCGSKHPLGNPSQSSSSWLTLKAMLWDSAEALAVLIALVIVLVLATQFF